NVLERRAESLRTVARRRPKWQGEPQAPIGERAEYEIKLGDLTTRHQAANRLGDELCGLHRLARRAALACDPARRDEHHGPDHAHQGEGDRGEMGKRQLPAEPGERTRHELLLHDTGRRWHPRRTRSEAVAD